LAEKIDFRGRFCAGFPSLVMYVFLRGEERQQMTRSERIVLERVLLELEKEMKNVQLEIDQLRTRLRSTDISRRRRSQVRMCRRAIASKTRL